MNDEDFLELVRAGERPGVEFKGPRSRGDKSFPEVVRAILGMANRRDGGIILIGVQDHGDPTGLSTADVESWRIADHVRQAVAGFADPFVYFDVEVVTVSAGDYAGRSFAVVKVAEFDQVPVLCAKVGYDPKGTLILQHGACYVRTSHMPSTTQVADHQQFRDLLDLAIEKGVRMFLKRATAAGLAAVSVETDDERFAAQRAGFDE